MNFSILVRRVLPAAGLVLVALAPMACGGDADQARSDPAAASRPAATQVAGGALSGAAMAGAAGAVPPTLARTEPVEAVTIVATDNAFTAAEFRVRAGQPFTVTLENRGQAAHDWRVRGLAAADGKDAGTRLLTSGQAHAITLTIDRPGTFALYCEVHPVDMRGKLTVISDQASDVTPPADR